jgi:GT2 family glycosyltransferase
MKPLVTVVIVVWNGIADTLECLRSLQSDLYPNKEILIVDNDSTDGTLECIQEAGFDVSLVRCPANLGFTGGNNVGLAESRRRGAKYAFLLNNDTTVEPAALGTLVEAAEERSRAALLSPAIYYHDAPEEVWFSGATLSLARGEAVHRFDGMDPKRPSGIPGRAFAEHPYQSAWLSGCALLVRMEAVEEVGGFDDRFFLTWEDVDWCVRMRFANWELLVVPGSRIYHKCGRSGARLLGIHRYYAVRNSLLLASKHAGFFYLTALFCVLGRHFRSALRSRSGDREQGLATIFEGLRDHLLGRYGRRPTARRISNMVDSGEVRANGDCTSNACISSK